MMDTLTRQRVMLFLEMRGNPGQARIPKGFEGGGRFRGIKTQLIALLKDWAKGEGSDDPLGELDSDPDKLRTKLRNVITDMRKERLAAGDTEGAARLVPRRGAPLDELKALLYQDAKHGDHDRAPAKVAPAKAAPKLSTDPAVREVQVENRIRAAYAKLWAREEAKHGPAQPGWKWVSLADLRDDLGESISREEVDRALLRMSRGDSFHERGIRVIPLANRKALKQRDHDAALRLNGEDVGHAISIEDPSPRPLPAPARKSTAAAKKAAPKAPVAKSALTGTEVQAVTKLGRLTEVQRKAVDRYGGDGSYVINADLRDRAGRVDLLTDRNRQTVEALDSVFAQSLLPQDAVLHRKGPLSGGPFGDLANDDHDLTGLIWTEDAYSSTSVAERMTGPRRVQMRIFAPKGTRAISHEVLDSDEVLLDRGTTFRVIADHGKNDRFDRVIDVEVVPAPAKAVAKRAPAKLTPAQAARELSGPDEWAQAARDGRVSRISAARRIRETAQNQADHAAYIGLGEPREKWSQSQRDRFDSMTAEAARLRALADEIEAKPAKKAAPKTPAEAPSLADAPDLSGLTTRLKAAKTREEAHAMLEGLSGDELKSIAKATGTSLAGAGASKHAMKTRIVEHTVGFRINSKTIREGTWDIGLKAPIDAPDLTGLTTRQKRAHLKALGYSPEQIDQLAPTAAAAKRAAPKGPAKTAIPSRPHTSLTADEQARVRRLVRRDPQIFATTHDRFGPVSTSGNLSNEDAAWLQSIYERDRVFVEYVAQDAHLERTIRAAAKKANQTPSEYRAATAARLKEWLAGKPIAVRVRDEAALRDILSGGRFKTQLEGARRAPGLAGGPDSRRLGERILGVPADASAEERPIYGYVAVSGIEPALSPGRKIPGIREVEGQEDVLSSYGQVQVVLKPGVRSRTTATVGDSLDEIGFMRPSPVDNPTAESLGFRDLDSVMKPGWTRQGYVEAQIHGGVRPGDIAEVVFPDAPDRATVAALDGRGIPWRVLRKGDTHTQRSEDADFDEFRDDEDEELDDLEEDEDEEDADDEPDVEVLTPATRARALAMATRAAGHDITPGNDELHHYWTRGEGLAKWLGHPHEWTALYHHLVKYAPTPEAAKRWASAWFHEVKGFYPGADLHRVEHGKPPRGHLVGPG